MSAHDHPNFYPVASLDHRLGMRTVLPIKNAGDDQPVTVNELVVELRIHRDAKNDRRNSEDIHDERKNRDAD